MVGLLRRLRVDLLPLQERDRERRVQDDPAEDRLSRRRRAGPQRVLRRDDSAQGEGRQARVGIRGRRRVFRGVRARLYGRPHLHPEGGRGRLDRRRVDARGLERGQREGRHPRPGHHERQAQGGRQPERPDDQGDDPSRPATRGRSGQALFQTRRRVAADAPKRGAWTGSGHVLRQARTQEGARGRRGHAGKRALADGS